MPFNIKDIRKQFPILSRNINGYPLAYLDNASTTQKPQCVLDAITRYYAQSNANIHRGIHTLSEEATKQYEDARGTVARFINATSEEIIFTRNTTESINLIAYSWGRANIKKGDVIMVSEMEHHSNLLPWHALAKETGAELRIIPIDKDGRLDVVKSPFGPPLQKGERGGFKLLAITHMSNVLGTINPVQEIIAQAHKAGAVVLVDAAQSAAHMPLDVKQLDADFLAFSGHKLYGPTGIGVLYGKRELLETMPPFLYGGDMVKAVKFSDRYDTCHATAQTITGIIPVGKFTPIWNDIPYKFEAGTPHIAGAIALAEALKFLEQIGWDEIRAYEQELTEYALEKLSKIDGLTIYGPGHVTLSLLKGVMVRQAHHDIQRGPVISFTLEGIHPHDLATVLNDQGIAIRSGHHCAMPLHQKLGVPATARISVALYTTKEEIDAAVEAIKKAQRLFSHLPLANSH